MSRKPSDRFPKSYEPNHRPLRETPEAATALELVTVEQEQARLDARRRALENARRLDRQRRLQATFGSWQPGPNRTTLH